MATAAQISPFCLRKLIVAKAAAAAQIGGYTCARLMQTDYASWPGGRLLPTGTDRGQNTVRRGFGHPQDMETGGRTGCGVCAAVHVHYLSTGGARAAAVLAGDATCAR